MKSFENVNDCNDKSSDSVAEIIPVKQKTACRLDNFRTGKLFVYIINQNSLVIFRKGYGFNFEMVSCNCFQFP